MFVELEVPWNDTEVRVLIALESIIIDKVFTAPTVRKNLDTSAPMEIGMKKETSESWTSHCKPFTKGQAKATGRSEKASWDAQRYTGGKVEIVEESVHDRRATARNEATEQIKVAKATAGHPALVAKQDTLQPRQKAATRTWMPWLRRKVKSMKKPLTLRSSRKNGVWKRENMHSGKK